MVRTSRYTSTAKFLHWLIVVLLAAQYIVAWTMPHIGRNTPVTTLISLHFSFGIIILAVAIVRLVWWGQPTPIRRRLTAYRPGRCKARVPCIGSFIFFCS